LRSGGIHSPGVLNPKKSWNEGVIKPGGAGYIASCVRRSKRDKKILGVSVAKRKSGGVLHDGENLCRGRKGGCSLRKTTSGSAAFGAFHLLVR